MLGYKLLKIACWTLAVAQLCNEMLQLSLCQRSSLSLRPRTCFWNEICQIRFYLIESELRGSTGVNIYRAMYYSAVLKGRAQLSFGVCLRFPASEECSRAERSDATASGTALAWLAVLQDL